MQYMKVDFSLDLLKKIVSGEVKGKIETMKGVYGGFEDGKAIAFTGTIVDLYIDVGGEEEPEPELKPFDKVIARYKGDDWQADFYSHNVEETIIAIAIGNAYECHPWRDCYAKYLGTNTPWEQIVKETEGEE